MAKDLPIDSRIVEQMSKATIKNLIDGIVELVTNGDDSYRRLEGKGQNVSGKIEIHVIRQKGGICKKLIVTDFAEGMSREELEDAIIFAGETKLGASIRGLFGRGLKETIMALGEGEVKTIKKGKYSTTRLWFDQKLHKPQYDDEILSKTCDTSEPSGTCIDIKITNEKIKITTYENFKDQLIKHFALRDINSSPNRKIILIFKELKNTLKYTTELKFLRQEDKKVFEGKRNIPGFGDEVGITVYESPEPLESPRNNPFGLAGILIKTSGCILDNQLFKFDTDPAGFYFYGEATCYGLEKRLRKGEKEILDPNRNGLEWRHDYSKVLAKVIEGALEPLILEKRKTIESTPKKELKSTTKKMLKKLCNLLNEMAQQELDEFPDFPVEPENYNVLTLMIKPSNANIPINVPRTFTIYAPVEIVKREGKQARITSDNYYIRPLSSIVKLEKHKKYPERLWYRYFKVVGIAEEVEGTITVNLGNEKASTKIKVAPFKKRKKGKISGERRGFISNIVPDELPDPSQRVVYRNGIIKVYTKFPSVSKFIKSSFDKIETTEGRLLLSELVGESFCKELAMQGIENGRYIKVAGAEIDSFNATINELQKKYLHKIQEIIFAWKF
ncbi:hypothetical protein CVT91_10030 [Candidatus Atribacteria bacterium HGW-Atribacteria-1]|nr:MAG: hypothetical protein CVT91_10030 [Candidatus Atribacteria bacterium HGW-Atribacteria-1]